MNNSPTDGPKTKQHTKWKKSAPTDHIKIWLHLYGMTKKGKLINSNESHLVMSSTLGPHGLYTVHGILQARILEWAAFPFSRGRRETFSTQGSNSGLLHCWQVLYQLSHKGSPRILEWVAYPFSSGSSPLRNWTGVSCIAGGFFTDWAIREAMQIANRFIIC